MNIIGVSALVMVVWAFVCRQTTKNTRIHPNTGWVFFIWGCVAILAVGLSAVGLMK